MNMIILMRTINVVNEQNLNVGHRLILIASNMFSSLAFLGPAGYYCYLLSSLSLSPPPPIIPDKRPLLSSSYYTGGKPYYLRSSFYLSNYSRLLLSRSSLNLPSSSLFIIFLTKNNLITINVN